MEVIMDTVVIPMIVAINIPEKTTWILQIVLLQHWPSVNIQINLIKFGRKTLFEGKSLHFNVLY